MANGFLTSVCPPVRTQALPTVQTLTAELNTTNDFGAFVRAVRREFRGLYA